MMHYVQPLYQTQKGRPFSSVSIPSFLKHSAFSVYSPPVWNAPRKHCTALFSSPVSLMECRGLQATDVFVPQVLEICETLCWCMSSACSRKPVATQMLTIFTQYMRKQTFKHWNSVTALLISNSTLVCWGKWGDGVPRGYVASLSLSAVLSLCASPVLPRNIAPHLNAAWEIPSC